MKVQDDEAVSQPTVCHREFPAWLALYIGFILGLFVGCLLGGMHV